MLTRNEILSEYVKCITDPTYAIGTYLKTYDQTQKSYVPFNLFEKQKEIVGAYEKYRYNLIAKPRQAGISTTTQAYMAIKIGFADSNSPETVVVIANKLTLAKKFLKGIKGYLSQLPRWVWGDEYYGTPEKEKIEIFSTNSTIELQLPNGSNIVAVATSEDALRGYVPTYLVFDEAAFIDRGADVYAAAMSSCATGGKAFLISTPNGYDSLYYKTYEQSHKGKNDYNIIEMRWYEDPRYNKDLTWIKKNKDGDITESIEEVAFIREDFDLMIKNGYKPTSGWYRGMCATLNNNARKIAQELDVSFLGSGGNVISDEDIKFQVDHNVMKPLWTDGVDDEYWIWEKPIPGHEYIMGVDVARGDGEDSSTMVIIDVTTMTQVVEYQGKVQPDLLGEIVFEYGNLYKAHTVVDITGGMGVGTVLKLLEWGFKFIHYEDPNGRKLLDSKSNQLEAYSKDDKIPGFNINGVRINLISHLEYMVRTNGIKIRSIRMTGEMKTFIYKNGRPDHMDGYHDDLLFALGMALFVLEHSFKKLVKLESQNKAMLSSWKVGGGSSQVEESYDGGMVSRDNKSHKTLPRPNLHPSVAKNVQDPRGEYLWLFSGSK